MKKISDSHYSDFFEASSKLFVLDTEEAEDVWDKIAAGKGHSLYNTPLAHWLKTSNWETISNWRLPFNGGEISLINDKIRGHSLWVESTQLLFVKDRRTILTFNFGEFCNRADELLSVFDDGPLLCGIGLEFDSAFRFAPIGNLLWRQQPGLR